MDTLRQRAEAHAHLASQTSGEQHAAHQLLAAGYQHLLGHRLDFRNKDAGLLKLAGLGPDTGPFPFASDPATLELVLEEVALHLLQLDCIRHPEDCPPDDEPGNVRSLLDHGQAYIASLRDEVFRLL